MQERIYRTRIRDIDLRRVMQDLVWEEFDQGTMMVSLWRTRLRSCFVGNERKFEHTL